MIYIFNAMEVIYIYLLLIYISIYNSILVVYLSEEKRF